MIMVAHDSHSPTTAPDSNPSSNGVHYSSSKVLDLDVEVDELKGGKSTPEALLQKADPPPSCLLLGDLRVHESEEKLKDASNDSGAERRNGSLRGTRVRRSINSVSRDDWARVRDSLDAEPLVPATHASKSFVSLSTNPASFGLPTLQWLVQPHNAIKVIKGEIHNVLNVMRADARYASPLRFVEELPLDEHPLLLQLKGLHTNLSVWEATHPTKAPQLLGYLAPFCSAVSGRDISGNITGAALSALHKFLLYGFVLPDTPSAHEGMALIARSLLQCTFEESAPGVSAEKRRINGRSVAIMLDDEQVVMKLLELIALVVRCSLLEAATLLEPDLVVGLLDTCLHVSLRAKMASPLLRSAADDALGQIVLQVFSGVGELLLPARTNVLTKLSSLLALSLDVRPCVTSLILLNIALETMRQEPSPTEISILQNDLCKHLLQLSTTHDLIILNLTLRVIFNLFQSIRNHLKVPLEVFLTSVHLRILDPTSSSTPEEREVALEGLLEFCQEPSLMQDIYLNYDCDVHCTNLYEAICSTLARVASQADRTIDLDKSPLDPINPNPVANGLSQSPLNVLSRLAVEGILAVIESIASRCQGEPPTYLRMNSASSSDVEEQEQEFEGSSEVEDVLKERKRKKHGLAKVAVSFNLNPGGPDWLKAATDLHVIPSPPTAQAVAEFLYATPGLDMAQVGLYLSKGPAKDYPFHAWVRDAFCTLFDFKGKNFAAALRNFLAKFRLPGEAQCIDRLMEAFSKELYKQQAGEASIFKSADSVFVLAFSTIMLNTDLHNPTIKEDRRMTQEQFTQNNRGINEGEDLPVEFLTELYEEIKTCEIQVQQDFTELQVAIRRHSGEDFRAAWDGILSKTDLVATPFFTSADAARQTVFQAGVHERDMFIAIAKSALQSISSAFARSRDDALVVKVLKGLEQMARVCIYFELDSTFNDIICFLMKQGKDYISRGIAKENLLSDPAQDAESFTTVNTDDSEQSNNDASLASIKFDASMTTEATKAVMGSAAHRGLLALDCALQQVRLQSSHLREAWPALIECLCVLRDAHALPTGLADLDDFADSKSNVLPLSAYAKESLRKVEEHYRLHTDQSKPSKKGWFRMPRFKHGTEGSSQSPSVSFQSAIPRRMSNGGKPSPFTLSLLSVSEAAELESIILMCSGPLPRAKQTIRALLDTVHVNALEQHAVFSLELAARALLSTREQCAELFPLFLSKFESLLSLRMDGDSSGLPSPFLMERVVITILRSTIHLYDLKAMRCNLRLGLKMLMSLPKKFVRHVSDRMACGLAIILRGSFQLFRTELEWAFLAELLDMLAHFGPGRRFIFDGVASTIEFAFPASNEDESLEKGKTGDKLPREAGPVLSRLLIRFILAKYENDHSLAVPAMHCLEKIYRRMYLGALVNKEIPENGPRQTAFDVELWQNVAVAFYTVCRYSEPDISRQGWECFHRFILSTPTETVPASRWLGILFLVVNRQPPVTADIARVNTFSVLGQLLMWVFPYISRKEDHIEDLKEVITQTASVAAENLKVGRRGSVSPLFEQTVRTVTHLSNQMMSPNFGGDQKISQWASETLLLELEKVGAGGGSIQNVAATTKNRK